MAPKMNQSTPPSLGLFVRNIKLVTKEIYRILNSKSKIVYIVNPKKN